MINQILTNIYIYLSILVAISFALYMLIKEKSNKQNSKDAQIKKYDRYEDYNYKDRF